MSYYQRIAAFSAATLALTMLLVLFGPQGTPLTLVAHSPIGEEAPAGAAIRATFSRPVDRQSAEASFRITPSMPGRFFWEDQTLTFQPLRPLNAGTRYKVSFGPGLLDAEGRELQVEPGWEFRTRGPRLLAIRSTSTGGGELWLTAPDGQGARMLLAVADGIGEVAVAPDGTRAVYTASRGAGRNALMLLDLESGATRALLDDAAASVAAPAWDTTGDFIAFERRALRDGSLGVPRVWLAQPDGTLLHSLVGGDGSDISYGPVWSPDGNLVAFIDGSSQALKVYSFFTGAVRELPAVSGERPSWLPDNSGLIFSNSEIGPEGPALRLRLVTLGVEPGGKDLTDGMAAELSPAVSPDGAVVAFTRRDQNEPASRVWLVSSAGGPPSPLSAAGAHQDTQPVWSPDGQLLAFVRRNTSGLPESRAIVIDPATGVETIVLVDVAQVVWAP